MSSFAFAFRAWSNGRTGAIYTRVLDLAMGPDCNVRGNSDHREVCLAEIDGYQVPSFISRILEDKMLAPVQLPLPASQGFRGAARSSQSGTITTRGLV